MSKKENKILTFEELAAETKRKKEKNQLFCKTFEKALAFFIAIALVYSIAYIAFLPNMASTTGTNSGNTNTGSSQTVNSTTSVFDNADTTTAAANNGVATTAAANSSGGTSTSSKPTGNNIAVIVPYFVTAHNKVKSSAKSATNTWKKGSNYNSIVEVGSSALLKKFGQSLMGSLLKEETPNAIYTATADAEGATIQSKFPPAGASCGLKASDVTQAVCKEVNGEYVIYLQLKKDVNPQAGQGSGSVASVITESQITEPTSKIGLTVSNTSCAYEGAYVETHINIATGNMTYYYFKLPMILSATALRTDAKIGLEFEEKWDIAW